MTGPAADRAARRQVARRHHPDVGGDPEAFVAAMRALDSRPSGTGAGPVGLRPSARHRARRGTRRLVHRLRTRLPRAVPGARRYGRI